VTPHLAAPVDIFSPWIRDKVRHMVRWGQNKSCLKSDLIDGIVYHRHDSFSQDRCRCTRLLR